MRGVSASAENASMLFTGTYSVWGVPLTGLKIGIEGKIYIVRSVTEALKTRRCYQTLSKRAELSSGYENTIQRDRSSAGDGSPVSVTQVVDWLLYSPPHVPAAPHTKSAEADARQPTSVSDCHTLGSVVQYLSIGLR